jgi:hypothetical protein
VVVEAAETSMMETAETSAVESSTVESATSEATVESTATKTSATVEAAAAKAATSMTATTAAATARGGDLGCHHRKGRYCRQSHHELTHRHISKSVRRNDTAHRDHHLLRSELDRVSGNLPHLYATELQ